MASGTVKWFNATKGSAKTFLFILQLFKLPDYKASMTVSVFRMRKPKNAVKLPQPAFRLKLNNNRYSDELYAGAIISRRLFT